MKCTAVPPITIAALQKTQRSAQCVHASSSLPVHSQHGAVPRSNTPQRTPPCAHTMARVPASPASALLCSAPICYDLLHRSRTQSSPVCPHVCLIQEKFSYRICCSSLPCPDGASQDLLQLRVLPGELQQHWVVEELVDGHVLTHALQSARVNAVKQGQ